MGPVRDAIRLCAPNKERCEIRLNARNLWDVLKLNNLLTITTIYQNHIKTGLERKKERIWSKSILLNRSSLQLLVVCSLPKCRIFVEGAPVGILARENSISGGPHPYPTKSAPLRLVGLKLQKTWGRKMPRALTTLGCSIGKTRWLQEYIEENFNCLALSSIMYPKTTYWNKEKNIHTFNFISQVVLFHLVKNLAPFSNISSLVVNTKSTWSMVLGHPKTSCLCKTHCRFHSLFQGMSRLFLKMKNK